MQIVIWKLESFLALALLGVERGDSKQDFTMNQHVGSDSMLFTLVMLCDLQRTMKI